MKIQQKFVSGIITIAVVAAMCVPTLATTYRKTLVLPEGKVWVNTPTVTRTTKNSYAQARCISVYPDSGLDVFSAIRARVTDTRRNVISKEVTLSEGLPMSRIDIKDGNLDIERVVFEFRGNSQPGANAEVEYNPK